MLAILWYTLQSFGLNLRQLIRTSSIEFGLLVYCENIAENSSESFAQIEGFYMSSWDGNCILLIRVQVGLNTVAVNLMTSVYDTLVSAESYIA